MYRISKLQDAQQQPPQASNNSKPSAAATLDDSLSTASLSVPGLGEYDDYEDEGSNHNQNGGLNATNHTSRALSGSDHAEDKTIKMELSIRRMEQSMTSLSVATGAASDNINNRSSMTWMADNSSRRRQSRSTRTENNNNHNSCSSMMRIMQDNSQRSSEVSSTRRMQEQNATPTSERKRRSGSRKQQHNSQMGLSESNQDTMNDSSRRMTPTTQQRKIKRPSSQMRDYRKSSSMDSSSSTSSSKVNDGSSHRRRRSSREEPSKRNSERKQQGLLSSEDVSSKRKSEKRLRKMMTDVYDLKRNSHMVPLEHDDESSQHNNSDRRQRFSATDGSSKRRVSSASRRRVSRDEGGTEGSRLWRDNTSAINVTATTRKQRQVPARSHTMDEHSSPALVQMKQSSSATNRKGRVKSTTNAVVGNNNHEMVNTSPQPTVPTRGNLRRVATTDERVVRTRLKNDNNGIAMVDVSSRSANRNLLDNSNRSMSMRSSMRSSATSTAAANKKRQSSLRSSSINSNDANTANANNTETVSAKKPKRSKSITATFRRAVQRTMSLNNEGKRTTRARSQSKRRTLRNTFSSSSSPTTAAAAAAAATSGADHKDPTRFNIFGSDDLVSTEFILGQLDHIEQHTEIVHLELEDCLGRCSDATSESQPQQAIVIPTKLRQLLQKDARPWESITFVDELMVYDWEAYRDFKKHRKVFVRALGNVFTQKVLPVQYKLKIHIQDDDNNNNNKYQNGSYKNNHHGMDDSTASSEDSTGRLSPTAAMDDVTRLIYEFQRDPSVVHLTLRTTAASLEMMQALTHLLQCDDRPWIALTLELAAAPHHKDDARWQQAMQEAIQKLQQVAQSRGISWP